MHIHCFHASFPIFFLLGSSAELCASLSWRGSLVCAQSSQPPQNRVAQRAGLVCQQQAGWTCPGQGRCLGRDGCVPQSCCGGQISSLQAAAPWKTSREMEADCELCSGLGSCCCWWQCDMFGMETPERTHTDISAGQSDPLRGADKQPDTAIQDTLFQGNNGNVKLPI